MRWSSVCCARLAVSSQRRSSVPISARFYSYRAFGWTQPPPDSFEMNTSYLQVLGTGQTDSFPSVGLMCPKVRLVFNCSENQQRVLAEHTEGLRLSRVNCFFFTRGHWGNIAGLPGSCLTHWQVRKYSLKYCGPRAASKILRSLVPFVMHPAAMPSVLHEYSEDRAYPTVPFDDGVKVTPLVFSVPITQPVRPPQLFSPSRSASPSPVSSDGESDASDSPDRRPKAKRPYVGAFSRSPSPTSTSAAGGVATEISTAYVCQLPDMQGTFLPKKAQELGVPKGTTFGQLSSGKPVTLPDGRVITPEQVTEPLNLGTCFIVVECATPDFVAPITGSGKFSRWQAGGEDADRLVVVVHMTPQDIIDTEPYQTWIKSFAPAVKHLFLNSTVASAPLVQLSGTQLQAQLNILDKRVFPVPHYSYELPEKARTLPANCRSGDLMLNFALYKRTGRKNQMRHGWSDSNVQTPINVAALQSNLLSMPAVLPVVEELHRALADLEKAASASASTAGSGSSAGTTVDARDPVAAAPEAAAAQGDFLAGLAAATASAQLNDGVLPWSKESSLSRVPVSFDPRTTELIFLGTGASIPGKYRNVSAIMLRFGDMSLLMDGGEGTLGQMYRQFGLDTDDVLCGLNLVSISHIHADHQSGIISILLEREAAAQRLGRKVPPMVVIGPTSWLTFFKYLGAAMQIPEISFFGTNSVMRRGLPGHVLHATGLPVETLRTHPVNHSVPAWAVEIRLRGAEQADGTTGKGFTVVYSGDTKPCNTFADAARGADLLIHEATFDSGLTETSMDKFHSTIGEALGIGARMKSGFVILTHFSQRYKLPVLSDCAGSLVPFGVAFDMMTVRLGELSRLEKIVPTLHTLFDARSGVIDASGSPSRRSPSPHSWRGSPHNGARRRVHSLAEQDGSARPTSPAAGSPRGRTRERDDGSTAAS